MLNQHDDPWPLCSDPNTEDKTLQLNKLRLLATFVSFTNTIADLSFIKGEKLTSP